MTLYYQWHLQGEEQLTVKDLPLRSILDIEGHRFILMAKNHEGHPNNSATLISEKIYDLQPFGATTKYLDSSIRTYLQTDFLNLFSHKNLFLDVTFKTTDVSNDTYYELTDKFFLLSSTEVGLESDGNEGSNIGFTSNADRIAYRLDNGSAYHWWLRTPLSSSYVRRVGSGGSLVRSTPSYSYGVRPACCISLDNKVTKNDDGYYTIIGDTTMLIPFTIGNISYYAEEGMTWKEWVETERNTQNYYINNNMVVRDNGRDNPYIADFLDNSVSPNDVIIANHPYTEHSF